MRQVGLLGDAVLLVPPEPAAAAAAIADLLDHPERMRAMSDAGRARMGPPGVRTALSELGETQQGIVVWHHALLGHPDWPLWSDLIGIENRQFG